MVINGATGLVHRMPWAGLALGPGAWAISTQANYAFAPWACSLHVNAVPYIALLLVLISFSGAAVSAMTWFRSEPYESDGHPHQLLAGVGTCAGILFGLVILMQGAAGLIVDPCLR
jgi:hypothetical protein